MRKAIFISVMGFLVAASLVRGQSSESPAWPKDLESPTRPKDKEPSAPQGPQLLPPPPEGGCVEGTLGGPKTKDVIYASGDYLLWFLFSRRGLVPVGDLAPTGAGAGPAPGGSAIGGGAIDTIGEVNQGRTALYPGGRFNVAYAIIDDNPWVKGSEIRLLAAEVSVFFLAQRSTEVRDDVSNALVRPFFDFNDRREAAVIVAAPGLATGTLDTLGRATLWGGEANVWKNIYFKHPGATCSLDVLAGFRFLQFNGDIEISRSSVYNTDLTNFPAFAALGLAGSRIQEKELFGTHNNFYGAQIGISNKLFFERATLETTFKWALGATNEVVRVDGRQVQTLPDGSTRTFVGALLAQPSNIGRFSQAKLTQVPAVEANLRFPLGDHFRFNVGVTTFYWSRLLRATDQIDTVVDVRQIHNFPAPNPPGVAIPNIDGRPSVPFNQTHLMAFGVNIGFAVVW
jgi:hypothetical protein